MTCQNPECVKEIKELKRRANFIELTGTEIPADELKAALAFEDFNSKEQMMCGWQKVHRELHIVAVAYRKAEAEVVRLKAGLIDSGEPCYDTFCPHVEALRKAEAELAEIKSLVNSDKYDGSALCQMYLAQEEAYRKLQAELAAAQADLLYWVTKNAGQAINIRHEMERADKAESLAKQNAQAVERMRDNWQIQFLLLDSWRPIGWKDHACAECFPNGESLVSGFSCGYHVAKKMAALAQAPAPEVP